MKKLCCRLVFSLLSSLLVVSSACNEEAQSSSSVATTATPDTAARALQPALSRQDSSVALEHNTKIPAKSHPIVEKPVNSIPRKATDNGTMQLKTPTVLAEKLGIAIAGPLLEADSVVAFLLDPEGSNNAGNGKFNGFPLVNEPKKLTLAQSNYLRQLISNPAYYPESSFIKNCTFLPDVGFRFYGKHNKKTNHADLLIAFYCDDWLFTDGTKKITKDSKSARMELLRFIQQIFPGDEYLKKIPLKN